MFYTWMNSPVGKILLAGQNGELHYISFTTGKKVLEPNKDWIEDATQFAEPIAQLTDYFAGKLQAFSLNLVPNGTAFQLEVLDALQKIPYGETISYGELAKRVGRPKASRAVGAANGRNPLPIVIPCHRVIGSNGSLTGFGGGLDAKQTLLAHEQKYA